jgi:DNA-binding transcriptional MocR family regulator
MDEDLATTLAELERKLQELEQTLWEIGRDAEARGAAPATPARPAEAGAASGLTTQAEPAWAPARPVDTAAAGRVSTSVEPAWAPPPAATAEDRAPDAEPTWVPPAAAAGRIVDESIEPGNPAAPSSATAAAQPEPSPPAAPPGTPRAGSQLVDRSPSAAELLRFRARLEQAARELTHDYDQLLGRLSFAAVPTPSAPVISFARGAPSLDIIDVDGLRAAALAAFENDAAGTTAYGTAVGYPRLRSWIAERHGVEPERVLVTNGSMQADAFLFEQLVRPGDEVVVERPTYDRTLLSLRQRGARVHQVELEPDGIDVEELARLLHGTGMRPQLAHIIPNFQNPAGYTLSLDKRRALLELAAEYGFALFEDDPYVALRFSGEPLPTMLSLDPERVIYASSFSKTVCPGIRVGYLVGPPDTIGAIAQLATNTYISPNMVAQSIVYEFSASGALERSIETVRAALAERSLALAEALRRELPEADFVPPQGGYFMWVTLPEGTDGAALHHAAAERGVSFVKGTDFLLQGGENTLRLAYSGVTPEQIEVGVQRLAEAFRSL